jgi:hypothetical protein
MQRVRRMIRAAEAVSYYAKNNIEKCQYNEQYTEPSFVESEG